MLVRVVGQPCSMSNDGIVAKGSCKQFEWSLLRQSEGHAAGLRPDPSQTTLPLANMLLALQQAGQMTHTHAMHMWLPVGLTQGSGLIDGYPRMMIWTWPSLERFKLSVFSCPHLQRVRYPNVDMELAV
jgi:hypothetical protein